jgi:TonB family protein
MKSRRKTWIFYLLASALFQANAQKRRVDPALTIVDKSPASPGDLIPPFPLRLVNPTFPTKIKKKQQRGEIVLQGIVATDGSVQNLTQVSGNPTFAAAAIEAVRHWRYLPAIQHGVAVEVPRTINLKYDLGKDAWRPKDPVSAPTAPSEDVLHELQSGELFRVGPGIKAPRAVCAPDPEYTEEARLDLCQGSIMLGVVIAADGTTRSVWVVQSLGKGLDERAVKAVSTWRFAPAIKDGEPVAVLVNVEST